MFQKHNIVIKPVYTSKLTTSKTKVDARKYLTQIVFIRTPALQIRASPTITKHHDKSSDKLQTTKEQIKAAQYLTISLNVHAVKTLT